MRPPASAVPPCATTPVLRLLPATRRPSIRSGATRRWHSPMQYFKELYPELTVTGFCDNYVKPLQRAEIDVNLSWLEKRLGKHLTNAEMEGKLTQLGFDVQIDGDNMHVTAPTWRSTGDISIKDDVMEEVCQNVRLR